MVLICVYLHSIQSKNECFLQNQPFCYDGKAKYILNQVYTEEYQRKILFGAVLLGLLNWVSSAFLASFIANLFKGIHWNPGASMHSDGKDMEVRNTKKLLLVQSWQLGRHVSELILQLRPEENIKGFRGCREVLYDRCSVWDMGNNVQGLWKSTAHIITMRNSVFLHNFEG